MTSSPLPSSKALAGPMFNINKFLTSALALSFVLGANIVQANPLIIKAEGNGKNKEIREKFEQLEKQSKIKDNKVAALAFFQMAEMLIEGFYDHAPSNGVLALDQYENVVKFLHLMPHVKEPSEEHLCSNCVSSEVLDQLRRARVTSINRLTDLYLKRDQIEGGAHVCVYEKFDRVVELQESILKDKDLYTADEQAEAYFQLGLLAPEGKRKYFKCLERAAELNHEGAISTLASYAEDKTTKLQEALRRVTKGKPVYDSFSDEQRTRFHKEIFIRYAMAQVTHSKKLDRFIEALPPDGIFPNDDQFLTYAIKRLVKEEMNQATERCNALVSRDQLGLENLRLSNKITALTRLDYVALSGLYKQEAERLDKRAAAVRASKLEEKAPAVRAPVSHSNLEEDRI